MKPGNGVGVRGDHGRKIRAVLGRLGWGAGESWKTPLPQSQKFDPYSRELVGVCTLTPLLEKGCRNHSTQRPGLFISPPPLPQPWALGQGLGAGESRGMIYRNSEPVAVNPFDGALETSLPGIGIPYPPCLTSPCPLPTLLPLPLMPKLAGNQTDAC